MRRKTRSMSQINVVPYIDVMLVLLVIFMVAAPMMQPSVVNLPSVDRADKEMQEIPLRLEVLGEHRYDLIDQGKTISYATDADLIAAIQSILSDNAERPVVIAADKTVQYALVMDTMNALKRARVVRVGLLVESKK